MFLLVCSYLSPAGDPAPIGCSGEFDADHYLEGIPEHLRHDPRNFRLFTDPPPPPTTLGQNIPRPGRKRDLCTSNWTVPSSPTIETVAAAVDGGGESVRSAHLTAAPDDPLTPSREVVAPAGLGSDDYLSVAGRNSMT